MPMVIESLSLAERGLSLHPCNIHKQNGEVVHLARDMAARAERLGLPALKSALNNVRKDNSALSVLRCAYISQLHRRALPLSN